MQTQARSHFPIAAARMGCSFPKYFTEKLEAGKTPYDEIAWELRTAAIANDKGAIIFEQNDVEVPADWSQTATNIVVSKYFHGKMGSPERETSVRQLVHRVVDTIADWGKADRYFRTEEDAENFRNELAHLMLTQKACFNSPVWFNVGVNEARGYGYYYDEATDSIVKLKKGESRPQCSACFINSVKDSLESILDLAKTEGMLFKWGSGTGTNLSPLREENGPLAGGGSASGPLSFMKGFDAFAGVIKSGGKTRRAAKMVILNVDHPDVGAVRLVQGQGREEGSHADRSRLRCDAGWRSVRFDLLPERQQLGARDRRVHAEGLRPTETGGRARWPTASPRSATTRRICCARSPKQRISAATRACSSTPPSIAGILPRRPRALTLPIPVRSTCSWTIRPAIWHR